MGANPSPVPDTRGAAADEVDRARALANTLWLAMRASDEEFTATDIERMADTMMEVVIKLGRASELLGVYAS